MRLLTIITVLMLTLTLPAQAGTNNGGWYQQV
jgi:hypothetical protein